MSAAAHVGRVNTARFTHVRLFSRVYVCTPANPHARLRSSLVECEMEKFPREKCKVCNNFDRFFNQFPESVGGPAQCKISPGSLALAVASATSHCTSSHEFYLHGTAPRNEVHRRATRSDDCVGYILQLCALPCQHEECAFAFVETYLIVRQSIRFSAAGSRGKYSNLGFWQQTQNEARMSFTISVPLGHATQRNFP